MRKTQVCPCLTLCTAPTCSCVFVCVVLPPPKKENLKQRFVTHIRVATADLVCIALDSPIYRWHGRWISVGFILQVTSYLASSERNEFMLERKEPSA